MAGDETIGPRSGPGPLEGFHFGSVNPFELLSELDVKQLGDQKLSREDNAVWNSLIDMLRDRNDEPWVAENLAKMAIERSRGAALALHGTTHQPTRRRIMQAMEDYMRFVESRSKARNPVYRTVPRALAGTSDPEEIDFLCRVALWHCPQSVGLRDEDFRGACIEALLFKNDHFNDNDTALDALLSLLVTIEPRELRQKIAKFIAEGPGELFQKKCRKICDLPKRKALYHIARHLQKKGALRSSLVATLARWRRPYRDAIANLWAIATQSPESVPPYYL